MKLSKQDQEFRNPKLFYPDPKSVDLDRVLVNLFLLLRCNGTRPVSRGRPKAGVEKIEYHVDQLSKLAGVSGIAEHPEVAKGWLESDIFDIVNRGTSREAVSSLRPLHLDAHKLRVAKHCRDYNVADLSGASTMYLGVFVRLFKRRDFAHRSFLAGRSRGRPANTRYDTPGPGYEGVV